MKFLLTTIVSVFVFAAVHGNAAAQIAVPTIQPLYEPSETFVEEEFKWSIEKGTGVIAGQGSLRVPGGYIKTAVGEEVALIAKNAYTDEIVSATRSEGFFDEYQNVNKAPGYETYRRAQTADKEGRFRFENLPAGEWYIVTRVIWYTRDELGKVSVNGGLLWGQITIGEGEVRDDVDLNNLVYMVH